MNNVIKKTVVITGASSGIGEACVEQMLHAGWRVFATVRKMDDAAKNLLKGGGRFRPRREFALP